MWLALSIQYSHPLSSVGYEGFSVLYVITIQLWIVTHPVCLNVRLNAFMHIYHVASMLIYGVTIHTHRWVIVELFICTLLFYCLEYLVAVRAKVGEMVRNVCTYKTMVFVERVSKGVRVPQLYTHVCVMLYKGVVYKHWSYKVCAGQTQMYSHLKS